MRTCSVAVRTTDEMGGGDKSCRVDECSVVRTHWIVLSIGVVGHVAV